MRKSNETLHTTKSHVSVSPLQPCPSSRAFFEIRSRNERGRTVFGIRPLQERKQTPCVSKQQTSWSRGTNYERRQFNRPPDGLFCLPNVDLAAGIAREIPACNPSPLLLLLTRPYRHREGAGQHRERRLPSRNLDLLADSPKTGFLLSSPSFQSLVDPSPSFRPPSLH
ncbi:unnamed protein product, partial [Ectocarpus sp. 12 AP-2014]